MAKRKSYARRNGGGVYRYTPKRRAALTRAQRISAQKRKRNSNITKGVIVGATLVGVGAAAVYGYKNRSTIKATGVRWKAAVQPGSKERVRLANALGGNLVKVPSKKTSATKGAKTMTRTQIAAVHPDVVDPNRNNAFPRRQQDVEVVNSLIQGSDRPSNIDKFLPKGVKGLVYGKKVTGNAASRATAVHAQAKGAMDKADVDASGILHSMIADGSVTRAVLGKENKRRKAAGKDPLPTPKNSRAGKTRKKNNPTQNPLRDWTEQEKQSGAAWEYWLNTGRSMHPSNYRD